MTRVKVEELGLFPGMGAVLFMFHSSHNRKFKQNTSKKIKAIFLTN
jgi:hypothetical protein